MHFVIAPTSLVDFSIVSLEVALSLSNSLLVFSLVLIASQVIGEAKSIPTSLEEHPLVAKLVLEQHGANSMHLPIGIDLSVVYVAIKHSLHSIYPFN